MIQPNGGVAERPGSRFLCCGVRVDALTPEAARETLANSRFGRPRRVHLCNAYTLSLAMRKAPYRQLLNQSDLNLADGQPVAFVGRRLGHDHLHSSVRGPTLMLDVLERGQSTGLRHYFYGSTPQVCEHLQREVEARFPAAKVVGLESPPFRRLTRTESTALTRRMRAAQPDIVWVGLGTPRQDRFARDFRDRLGTTIVTVGAGFDFLAGTKPVAPHWMQQAGLEWLFRLGSEPRRLWRRYLIGNSIFIYGATRDLAAVRREKIQTRQTARSRL